MGCRIFTDPGNGTTYHDLLESATLAAGFGYAGFIVSHVELGVSRVYVRAPTGTRGLVGDFELFAADVLLQLASINQC